MATHSEEAKAEIKRAYEGGESLKGIAKRTGIDPKTIRSWRDAQGWIPPIPPPGDSPEVREAVKAKVFSIATGRAIDQLEQSGAIEAQADLIAENLTLHGRIGNLALKAVEQTFADYNANAIKPGVNQNQADVLQSVLRAAKLGIDMTRNVAGLKAGQVSAKSSSDDGRRRFEFFVAPEPSEQISQAS
jgi:transposase-like protein